MTTHSTLVRIIASKFNSFLSTFVGKKANFNQNSLKSHRVTDRMTAHPQTLPKKTFSLYQTFIKLNDMILIGVRIV